MVNTKLRTIKREKQVEYATTVPKQLIESVKGIDLNEVEFEWYLENGQLKVELVY